MNSITISAVSNGQDEQDTTLASAFIASQYIPPNYQLIVPKKKNSKFYVWLPNTEHSLLQIKVLLWEEATSKVVQIITKQDLIPHEEGKWKLRLQFNHTISKDKLSRITFAIEYYNAARKICSFTPPKAFLLYNGGGSCAEHLKQYYEAYNSKTGSHLKQHMDKESLMDNILNLLDVKDSPIEF